MRARRYGASEAMQTGCGVGAAGSIRAIARTGERASPVRVIRTTDRAKADTDRREEGRPTESSLT